MADDALIERGRAALLAGDYRLARSCFDDVLARHPELSECWFLSGAAAHRLHELEGAKLAFSRACALDRQHLQARLALAAVSVELGDSAAAVDACRQAAAIAPDDPQVRFSLAVGLESAGLFDEALANYEQVLRALPDFADAPSVSG